MKLTLTPSSLDKLTIVLEYLVDHHSATSNAVITSHDEMKELIRLARLGLWAEEHKQLIVAALEESRLTGDKGEALALSKLPKP